MGRTSFLPFLTGLLSLPMTGCLSGSSSDSPPSPNASSEPHQYHVQLSESVVRNRPAIAIKAEDTDVKVQLSPGKPVEFESRVSMDELQWTIRSETRLQSCFVATTVRESARTVITIDCDNSIWFVAGNGNLHEAPSDWYVTDGSVEGTQRIAAMRNLMPAVDWSHRRLFFEGRRLLRQTDPADAGALYWLSDGTASGTVPAPWSSEKLISASVGGESLYLLSNQPDGSAVIDRLNIGESGSSFFRALPVAPDGYQYDELAVRNDRLWIHLSSAASSGSTEPELTQYVTAGLDSSSDLQGPVALYAHHKWLEDQQSPEKSAHVSWSYDDGTTAGELALSDGELSDLQIVPLPQDNISFIRPLALYGGDLIVRVDPEVGDCTRIYVLASGKWHVRRDLCSQYRMLIWENRHFRDGVFSFIASGTRFNGQPFGPEVWTSGDFSSFNVLNFGAVEGKPRAYVPAAGGVYLYTTEEPDEQPMAPWVSGLFARLYFKDDGAEDFRLLHEGFTTAFFAIFATTLSSPEFVGNRLIFGMGDTQHGLEPWVSDSTEAGTELLIDSAPGEEFGLHPGFMSLYRDK